MKLFLVFFFALLSFVEGALLPADYFCNSTCGNTPTGSVVLELNKCAYLCNPCDATKCIFQTHTMYQGGLYQVIWGDVNCTQFSTSFRYGCNSCASIQNTNNIFLHCDKIQYTNAIHGAAYCNNQTCGGTSVEVAVELNQCVWDCNPCNNSFCTFQSLQVQTPNVIQNLYSDKNCLSSSQQISYGCNECVVGSPSYKLSCASFNTSGTTSTGTTSTGTTRTESTSTGTTSTGTTSTESTSTGATNTGKTGTITGSTVSSLHTTASTTSVSGTTTNTENSHIATIALSILVMLITVVDN